MNLFIRVTPDVIEARKLEAKTNALDHYAKTGKRPTPGTSEYWRQLNWRLEHHGSSLPQICDEAGIPRVHKSRTMDNIKADVLDFIAKHGRQPIATKDLQFRPHDKWLRRRGTSLSWFCARMGYLPSLGGDRKKGMAAE